MSGQPPPGGYAYDGYSGAYNHNTQWQGNEPYREEARSVSPLDEEPYQSMGPSSAPPPPIHRNLPSAQPDSGFNRMQEQRPYGVAPPSASAGQTSPSRQRDLTTRRAVGSSSPERQRGSGDANPGPPLAHGGQYTTMNQRRESQVTPGMDSLGEAAAGGGINGIAMGVASTNERESGLQAIRDIDNLYSAPGPLGHQAATPPERQLPSDDLDYPGAYGYQSPPAPIPRRALPSHDSQNSMAPLAAAAAPIAATTPHHYTNSSMQENGLRAGAYTPDRYSYYDTPYREASPSNYQRAGEIGTIDPMDIDDDGGDPFGLPPSNSARKSRSNLGAGAAAIPMAGLAAGTGAAAGAGMVSKSRDASGNYVSVGSENQFEKPSEWLSSQTSGRKRLRWIVGIIIAIFVIAAIAGGVVGGVLGTRNNSSSSGGQSAAEDDGKGDLSKDSSEIKALLGNPNLHKVFPGMDYTPLNTQYPDCLHNPPSQNNVTRDLAMLSQLTNTLRLYGTDCNQTEMVIHGIQRLEVDMKLWLGVWLGNNDTTNTRQLSAMNDLLDKHGADPFAGVVVGNEVLFRKDLTATELGTILADVKSNLTAKGIDLPLATSDLGDNWTMGLASEVDVVMANIHPFFGGVDVDQAAAWTYSFWQQKDIPVTQGMTGKRHVISEVGWPSAGGNDCAPALTCPDSTSGAVAGIDEMNQFISDWVCQSLANGTEYFWFEGFDEPWKISFNTPGKEWEDKWGLMDVNRKLKDGVKIPDCGGLTV